MASARAPSGPTSPPTARSPRSAARLDDLPLAHRARRRARQGALTPRELLERLEQRLPLLTGGARDAPERQRTLRATIDWSHDLLDAGRAAPLRAPGRLPRRLHPRGRRAGRGRRPRHARSRSSTRASSAATSDRYWMLETIREYAAERLEAARRGRRAAPPPRRLLPRAGRGGASPAEGGRVPGHRRDRGHARARSRQPPRGARLADRRRRDAASPPADGRAGRVLVPGRLLD